MPRTREMENRSRMSRPLVIALLLGSLLPASQAARAQGAAPAEKGPDFQSFHAQCIGCHGIPGYKTAYPHVYHVPKIAGQQPGYIVAALKAYKSGDRSHPSMRGIAASLSEEQINELAKFYGAPAK
jgi:cytochrome c553